MGSSLPFHEPVKPFIGVITGHPDLMKELRPHLKRKWGEIDVESSLFPLPRETPHDEDLGPDLYRKLFSFRTLMAPDRLVDAKTWAVSVESRSAWKRLTPATRPLDIDPGYLTLSKIVLASAFDRSHRIALGNGVHAEVLMHWGSRVYTPREWTTPDFRTRPVARFFCQARERLKDQISRKEPR